MQGHRDIVDLATKCSETAAELLAELAKLKLDTKGGLRQTISKSVRAIRKKKFLQDTQSKLERYKTILDTRILVQLSVHSFQQTNDLQCLDQNVREFVAALHQGQTTVVQLLASQGQAVLDHIDQRLDDHAQASRDLQAQQQFKNSLWFPQVFSRRDDITEAHQGTYCWIFQPPDDSGSAESNQSGLERAENSQDAWRREFEFDGPIEQRQQWPNFVTWLEHGEEIYWLNGKPGSGKSTLIRYITEEISQNSVSKEALTKWADGTEIVTVSLFFWSLGNTALQKNLQGMLQSLLFQIADQRQDLIPLMMDRQVSSAHGRGESLQPLLIHEWTDRRLRAVLEQLLLHKPPSVSFCFLIDGLDEFIGDDDQLIETIRLLNKASRTKVCVSSRPEQIFRQGFSNSPQIRLQDLNHGDIVRAAKDSLLPVLRGQFPRSEAAIYTLMQNVIFKAQGVFLWLDLVAKDIRSGARNGDSIGELERRLELIPNTIQGLYEHMLSTLERNYLEEGIRYFRFLMAVPDETEVRLFSTQSTVTLLNYVCAENGPWEQVLKNDLAYFGSLEFHEICQNIETRILTRCAGLVEIKREPDEYLGCSLVDKDRVESHKVPNIFEKLNVSCHIREVSFIHKTVIEFLEGQSFFQDLTWRPTASLALLRGSLGIMSIIPITISDEVKENAGRQVISVGFQILRTMKMFHALRENYEALGKSNRAFEIAVAEMVERTYEIIERVDVSLNGPSLRWFERYKGFYLRKRSQVGQIPFNDVKGFAAFYGCSSYFLPCENSQQFSQNDINYLFTCAILGLDVPYYDLAQLSGYFTMVKRFLHEGIEPNKNLTSQFIIDSSTGPPTICTFNTSAWASFFEITASKMLWCDPCAHSKAYPIVNEQTTIQVSPSHRPWQELVESFVSQGADVNASIIHRTFLSRSPFQFVFEESPLAYLTGEHECKEQHLRSLLVEFLKARGALQRRRFRCIIHNPEGGPRTCYHVSEEQSRYMCKDYLQRDGYWDMSYEAHVNVFTEIRPSLTPIEMDDPLAFVLPDSWQGNG